MSACTPGFRAAWCAGGANVPALNELLTPFGIAFGDAILEGQVPLEPDKPYYASGANIVRFPAGGHLHGWQLADKATEGVTLFNHALHCIMAYGMIGNYFKRAVGIQLLAEYQFAES